MLEFFKVLKIQPFFNPILIAFQLIQTPSLNQLNLNKMKNTLLYVAGFLFMMSCSFTFNTSEIIWMWEDRIQVAIILVATSLFCLALYLFQDQRKNKKLTK